MGRTKRKEIDSSETREKLNKSINIDVISQDYQLRLREYIATGDPSCLPANFKTMRDNIVSGKV